MTLTICIPACVRVVTAVPARRTCVCAASCRTGQVLEWIAYQDKARRQVKEAAVVMLICYRANIDDRWPLLSSTTSVSSTKIHSLFCSISLRRNLPSFSSSHATQTKHDRSPRISKAPNGHSHSLTLTLPTLPTLPYLTYPDFSTEFVRWVGC